MRNAITLVLGFAAALAAAPSLSIAPAHADPAYKADTIADFFLTAAYGRQKSICIGTAAECPPPSPPAGEAAKFDLLVNFEFDSDKLTPAAMENLGQFAKALHDPRLKHFKFEVDGHTDATGAEEYNFGLSERRAAAAVAYLAAQGVDGSVLKARGFGKTQPRVPDPFSAENRRVETRLLDAKKRED